MILALFCNACQTVKAPAVEESSELSLNELIKNAANSGLTLTESQNSSISVEGVYPEQIGKTFALGEELSFAFVNQPNDWTPLPSVREAEASGAPAWSGLLIRKAEGPWEVLYKIPDDDFNPVGLTLQEESLMLDAADDSGAGSGEGILQRYVYLFDGVVDELLYTWQKEECNSYYVPETYTAETACAKRDGEV